MTPDDIRVSATWGACEAVRAGVTCVADASDSAMLSMDGAARSRFARRCLPGIVWTRRAISQENFEKLKAKVEELQDH